jgi:cyclopropane fatty-acyl-phospholipid synthase-like methyltransferase
MPDEIARHFLDELIGKIPEGGSVLDLGCGVGIPFDKYLVERGFQVTGIDISQKQIDLSKKNVPSARFLKGDFSEFDFGNSKFDAIMSFYAVFHIPREEHKDLFIRMKNLLKKNGIFLVSLGTSDEEYGEESDWCGVTMAWSTYDPETYKKMIDEVGLKILEEKFEGNPGDEEYHYWVLAQNN